MGPLLKNMPSVPQGNDLHCFSYPCGVRACSTLPALGPSDLTTPTLAKPVSPLLRPEAVSSPSRSGPTRTLLSSVHRLPRRLEHAHPPSLPSVSPPAHALSGALKAPPSTAGRAGRHSWNAGARRGPAPPAPGRPPPRGQGR